MSRLQDNIRALLDLHTMPERPLLEPLGKGPLEPEQPARELGWNAGQRYSDYLKAKSLNDWWQGN